MLATVYFFYTFPLTWVSFFSLASHFPPCYWQVPFNSIVQGWVSTENLRNIFPDIEEWQEDSLLLNNIFSGFIPALVWTVFFAICPPCKSYESSTRLRRTHSILTFQKCSKSSLILAAMLPVQLLQVIQTLSTLNGVSRWNFLTEMTCTTLSQKTPP